MADVLLKVGLMQMRPHDEVDRVQIEAAGVIVMIELAVHVEEQG